jgi:hypothetical protein
MNEFRTAVEARDFDAISSLLADDVVFRSPVVFTPYEGRDVTMVILRNVIEVFQDFHYVRELSDEDGHALIFEATVDGLTIVGCDFLRYDEAGKIVDFTVMVRPLNAAHALATAMAARMGVR